MQTVPVSIVPSLPASLRARQRTALVASADGSFRQKLAQVLGDLRWQVREAAGGAQAWAEAENALPEAVIVDTWLPDLDLSEFLKDFRVRFPQVDVVAAGGQSLLESPRGPYRQELLHALRHCQDTDTASWNAAPAIADSRGEEQRSASTNSWPVTEKSVITSPDTFVRQNPIPSPLSKSALVEPTPIRAQTAASIAAAWPTINASATNHTATQIERLPELIGNGSSMLEVSRRVRLVAPRTTPVLIEGPTGSGKELVAEALHRLSTRNRKPFVAINCAAIPEALLEAELFGHTRGAFTGAVQGRVGRIESADGGTLFLDEIGEMPLALQSKLLRFVECGELQRVGDNETVKVDVRIIAATHRPLKQQAQNGVFRSDLYYRLAVFLIRTPSLIEHSEDIPVLVDHFMQKMGREMPMKQLDQSAMDMLASHDWPGNVRELEHVLERAAILAGDAPVVTAGEIDFGLAVN